MTSKNRIYGYNRDKNIIQTIQICKCLDREQIMKLFFNKLKPESALRQSQHVMQRLYEKELVKRWRGDLDKPYIYFSKDFSQKEHITLLNWLFIHFVHNLKYEKIIYIEYQRNYHIVIPDLFVVTYNQFNTERPYRAYFFEMDNTISNKFDKIEKYNRLFEAKPFDQYVMLTAPIFPKIIIATTNKSRLLQINDCINKQNKHNLNFQTHLIWNIKEECLDATKIDFCDKFMAYELPNSLCRFN